LGPAAAALFSVAMMADGTMEARRRPEATSSPPAKEIEEWKVCLRGQFGNGFFALWGSGQRRK